MSADAAVEDPGKDDLYEVGVIGEIIKILEMPDESTTVILQGKMKRFRIDEITETFPYMRANVSLENEILPDANDKEFEALVSALKDLTFELLKNIGEQAKELVFAIRNIDSAHYLVNFFRCEYFRYLQPKSKNCSPSAISKNVCSSSMKC